MLRLAGLNCKLVLRTPWILRMLCSCLCSDPKMRLDTWENTVLIYSAVIQAGHQPAVKSCWKILKLGNNIRNRAKPAVLFLRLGALFQNYCLVFSCSLVFKRDPFKTKNYHKLGSINLFFFLSDKPQSTPWIDVLRVTMEFVVFFFSIHTSTLFCSLLETWRIWASPSLKIVIIGQCIKQLLVNSSHRTNTPPTKPKAPYSNHRPTWQPAPLIPLYPEQTINLLL